MIMLADLIGLSEPPVHSLKVPMVGPTRPLPGSKEERAALLAALHITEENITLTSHELGVSRVTLYRMLRRHGIELDRGLKAPPIMS
jgi:transcriptional regulator of acetoin/glycerol metabolism